MKRVWLCVSLLAVFFVGSRWLSAPAHGQCGDSCPAADMGYDAYSDCPSLDEMRTYGECHWRYDQCPSQETSNVADEQPAANDNEVSTDCWYDCEADEYYRYEFSHNAPQLVADEAAGTNDSADDETSRDEDAASDTVMYDAAADDLENQVVESNVYEHEAVESVIAHSEAMDEQTADDSVSSDEPSDEVAAESVSTDAAEMADEGSSPESHQYADDYYYTDDYYYADEHHGTQASDEPADVTPTAEPAIAEDLATEDAPADDVPADDMATNDAQTPDVATEDAWRAESNYEYDDGYAMEYASEAAATPVDVRAEDVITEDTDTTGEATNDAQTPEVSYEDAWYEEYGYELENADSTEGDALVPAAADTMNTAAAAGETAADEVTESEPQIDESHEPADISENGSWEHDSSADDANAFEEAMDASSEETESTPASTAYDHTCGECPYDADYYEAYSCDDDEAIDREAVNNEAVNNEAVDGEAADSEAMDSESAASEPIQAWDDADIEATSDEEAGNADPLSSASDTIQLETHVMLSLARTLDRVGGALQSFSAYLTDMATSDVAARQGDSLNR